MKAPRASTPPGLGVLALLALGALGSARADVGDPPGNAARLGYLEGAVSLEPAGTQDWTSAERNRPLTTGDRLWTDQDAVAELDLGSAVVRLGSMTGFAFLNLDDTRAQMQLSAGVIIVRVWDMSQVQNYEIDTPNLALTLQQPGVYRVEVDDSGGTTTIKVSEGQALVIGSDQSIPITTQQVMSFAGTTTLSYSAATLGPPDDFDSWSAARDAQEEQSPSWQYVADDTPGSNALDDNGRWMSTPEYGYVWTPVVVAPGWVPYRFGHWVWVAPWGWTWIDDARWGYAPFHYGRWVQWNGSWCWVPGPRGSRPMYAPALVAWTNPASGAARNVGWFPLGPREVYAPAYPVSNGYLLSVNSANTTVASATSVSDVFQRRVTNIHYINRTTSAVSTVPQTAFTSAQEVATRSAPVAAGALGAMAVAAAAPAIAPLRQSVMGAGAAPKTRPPLSFVNRPVVARTPLPRAPAPFEKQLAAIQASGGRPLATAELARLQPGAPTAEVHLVTARVSRPQPSLGDRARALESTSIPPATTTRTFVHDPTPTAPPSATQRWLATDDPAHAVGESSTMSVYHTDTPPAQVEVRPVAAQQSAQRAPRASSSPPPMNYVQPRPPQQRQKTESHQQGTSKKEPREESNPKAAGPNAKER
ncbi:MAG TPA: DUF6600 domain-containing protein [Steroidobacteraceae bacterium]|jgi:hypothetical protein|nr:DUF6600 domain-containing protein [Steroidobacteraceae bacterium]